MTRACVPRPGSEGGAVCRGDGGAVAPAAPRAAVPAWQPPTARHRSRGASGASGQRHQQHARAQPGGGGGRRVQSRAGAAAAAGQGPGGVRCTCCAASSQAASHSALRLSWRHFSTGGFFLLGGLMCVMSYCICLQSSCKSSCASFLHSQSLAEVSRQLRSVPLCAAGQIGRRFDSMWQTHDQLRIALCDLWAVSGTLLGCSCLTCAACAEM